MAALPRLPRTGKKPEAVANAPVATSRTERRDDLPRLSTGEKPYIVRTGDNYARIAAAEGVEEGDLRVGQTSMWTSAPA